MVRFGRLVVRAGLAAGLGAGLGAGGLAGAEPAAFPLRGEFPAVRTMEAAELAQRYAQVVVVDVRSGFEYDVVHMDKAHNIPMSSRAFEGELARLRAPGGAEPLVLYCNGVTCKKSYEAAERAQAAGFRNVIVFDAGVLSWVRQHPEKSVLLGQHPADLSKLVSSEEFLQHCLPLSDFKAAEHDPEAVFYDVRDPIQMAKKSDIQNTRYLPLDEILPLLKAGKFKEKKLYFMDAAGRQVEWLQYYLKEYGYSRYFFLRGGIDGS